MTQPAPVAAPARSLAGVTALAARLQALTGWRRYAAAATLGIVATAALPPIQLWPLVFVAFTGLVWMLEAAGSARPVRHAFAVGWWFGFGHFVTNLYWLAHALLIDAAQFGWMVPFAVFGLSGVLAVFTGAATAAAKATRARGMAGAVALAIAWAAGEWLRGHVLTGFPWNLIGTVWADTIPAMQAASLVGLYGLGLLTVLAAALPASIIAASSGLLRWVGPCAAVLLVAGVWVFGTARLPAESAAESDIRLRLVQPNVPQSLKWDPAQREANLRKTLALTRSPGLETRNAVIWPETAVPFVMTDFNEAGPALRQALAAATPPNGHLLTGAPRAVRDAEGRLQLWNSLHAVDRSGTIVSTYDKFHLVPFGEYVPLRSILRFAKVTVGTVDFSAGPGLETIIVPGLPPASALICYEAIFPGRVTVAGSRPSWLLNITNDAWFGMSSGPYQHFAAARFRAVEEGLPLVRAANNGISAVVDAYGRISAQLGLGETGVLDASLPPPVMATPYSRLGDLALLSLALLLAALAGGMHRKGW
jgi:apolipoprotein N-acyltransferase